MVPEGAAEYVHGVPRSGPSPEVVQGLYREGVDAFAGLARAAGEADAWDKPACGPWTAADLVRHEVDVISWYHDWLDRALAGDPSPAFDADELDDRTAVGVRALADLDPVDATERYATEAERYLERIPPHWDLAFGYPRGTVTVGLHAGLAATEWHLHAWDLAGALGTDHQPSDPGALLVAAAACLAVAPGGVVQKGQRALAPVAARARPWDRMLTTSGRQPRRGGRRSLG
jgi:uncharacterized protein (TIGR03083 family)